MTNKILIHLKKMFRDFETAKNFAYCIRNCVVNKANENGHVEIELELADEHMSPYDTIHGGFTATLINIVSGAAVLASGKPTVGRSVDLSISYQSLAKSGETIIAESIVQKTTRNLAFVNTRIYRKTDNMTIATGQDTKTFLPIE
uniref:4HBT domain-containing protein n=1 Tax=Onchocerca volvulus TaxID=6282 RepID=A0A8R1Y419_ONCVO